MTIEKAENLLSQLENNEVEVAIVDDNKNDLFLLKRELKKMGIQETSIHEYDNPKNLLEAVMSNKKIVVIISDLEMPGMLNGFELFVELIKNHYEGLFIIRSGAEIDFVEEMRRKHLSEHNFSDEFYFIKKSASELSDKHHIQNVLKSLKCTDDNKS